MEINKTKIEILSWLAMAGTALSNASVSRFSRSYASELAAIEWINEENATLTDRGRKRVDVVWRSLQDLFPPYVIGNINSLEDFKAVVKRGFN